MNYPNITNKILFLMAISMLPKLNKQDIVKAQNELDEVITSLHDKEYKTYYHIPHIVPQNISIGHTKINVTQENKLQNAIRNNWKRSFKAQRQLVFLYAIQKFQPDILNI